MSRTTGNSTPARGSSLLTGILIGMIIGVGMAAALAWFIMKSPSPFTQKDAVVAKPTAAQEAAPVANAPAAGAADGDKPRFEFYKVLTDKQEESVKPTAPEQKSAVAKPVAPKVVDVKPAEVKPAESTALRGPMYLQAGSFSNAGDAEKLKARIAFMGAEASIQVVTIPDRGVWHRVRLGPYKTADDMMRVKNTLKQNGVDATPIHAQ